MANHVSPPRGVWSAQPALQNQENPPQDAPAEGSIQESGSVVTNDGHSSIHCLTIIGQIEGHYILPSQNKTTKYEHVIPGWYPSNRIRKSKDCSSCSTPSAGMWKPAWPWQNWWPV